MHVPLFTVQSTKVGLILASRRYVVFIFVHYILAPRAKGTSNDFPFGDYIRGDTPLPIPNRAVKPSRADDT